MFFDYRANLENWIEHDNRNYFTKTNRNLYITGQELDPYKLHFAMVGNSKITNYNEKESLDPSNVINPNTGAVSVIWQNGNSYGILSNEDKSGLYEYNKENNTYDVKNRKQIYNVDTTIPNVKLSSPFLWTGDEGHSCGFNYCPPNGTILILGTKDTNSPVMLGTVPSDPGSLYPVLKSGEVSISGYGNNFIHWGQSDKITIFCGSIAGEADLDDPDSPIDRKLAKKNPSDCELEIVVNANDRLISINAWEKPNDEKNDDYNKCNKDARLPNGEQKTKIIISPDNIEIISNDTEGNETYYYQSSLKTIRRVKSNNGQSEEIIDDQGITVNTDFNYVLNAKNITMKALEKTYMSSDTYDIEVINNMSTSTNNYELDVNNKHKTTTSDYELDVNNELSTSTNNYNIDVNNELSTSTNNYNINVNNEHKIITKNYKVDTSELYQLESKETILASKEDMQIYSDDTMNVRVPGNGSYRRQDINGNIINIDVHHTPDEATSSAHKEPYENKKFRIDINGCNVNIDNAEDNHGPIMDEDDIGG